MWLQLHEWAEFNELNLAVCYWLVEVMIGSKHKEKLLFLYIDDIFNF